MMKKTIRIAMTEVRIFGAQKSVNTSIATPPAKEKRFSSFSSHA
jgi:hypothetical protein